MGKLILVTGGARSGKSTFAEKLAGEENSKAGNSKVMYIATAIPFDDEMKTRIAIHKKRRPGHWILQEAYRNLGGIMTSDDDGVRIIIVDCITIMITNIMMDQKIDWDNVSPSDIEATEDKVNNEIAQIINTAKTAGKLCICVSNEVGMGIVPQYAMARVFRDIAGRVNQRLAGEADEVFFCVSGIPLKIK